MNCPHCSSLNEKNLRRAFSERKPYRSARVRIVEGWQETVSPEGKPAVKGKFFCDACRQTITVVVELLDEQDPADWWKA